MKAKLRICLGCAAVAILLAPVLFTFWVSFSPDSFLTPPSTVWSIRWYRAFASDRRWSSATMRSLEVALLASLLSVLTTFPVAIACRSLRKTSRYIAEATLLLPAIVPAAALGTGLLPLMHASRLWGSMLAMVLVHATLGLPVVLLIARTALTTELQELESAARGLGASPKAVLLRVTLPLMTPSILAAGICVFVLSLNESLVSLFLATPANETLPTVVWPQLRYSASPLVAVASCVTTAIGVLGAAVMIRLIGRQICHVSR